MLGCFPARHSLFSLPSGALSCAAAPQVRSLLSRHSEVRVLNARGVAFAQADLLALLPTLK